MQVIVELAFIDELWMVGIDRLDFDGDFEVGFGVDGLVDLTEGSFIDLSDDLEVFSNFFQHLWHLFYSLKLNYKKEI